VLDVQWAQLETSAAEITFVAGGDDTLRDAAHCLRAILCGHVHRATKTHATDGT
jgi:hypothetical protein